MNGVSVLTKTYVTIGLVVLALFEFITAMYVFGRKGSKANPKLAMTLHRVGGYVFLIYWIWPMLIGISLLGRLSRYEEDWHFDGPRFYHAFLGVSIFITLLLKIIFVRFYPNFRPSARLLGILISAATIVTWLISGGFWLAMMGGRSVP